MSACCRSVVVLLDDTGEEALGCDAKFTERLVHHADAKRNAVDVHGACTVVDVVLLQQLTRCVGGGVADFGVTSCIGTDHYLNHVGLLSKDERCVKEQEQGSGVLPCTWAVGGLHHGDGSIHGFELTSGDRHLGGGLSFQGVERQDGVAEGVLRPVSLVLGSHAIRDGHGDGG